MENAILSSLSLVLHMYLHITSSLVIYTVFLFAIFPRLKHGFSFSKYPALPVLIDVVFILSIW